MQSKRDRAMKTNAAPSLDRSSKVGVMQKNFWQDKTTPILRDNARVSSSVNGESVGAGGLDVSGLLAFVADTFGSRLGGAIATQVANFSA